MGCQRHTLIDLVPLQRVGLHGSSGSLVLAVGLVDFVLGEGVPTVERYLLRVFHLFWVLSATAWVNPAENLLLVHPVIFVARFNLFKTRPYHQQTYQTS